MLGFGEKRVQLQGSLDYDALCGQGWDACDVHLLNLQRMNAKKYLYRLYAERVVSMRLLSFDPEWDGATNFETK